MSIGLASLEYSDSKSTTAALASSPETVVPQTTAENLIYSMGWDWGCGLGGSPSILYACEPWTLHSRAPKKNYKPWKWGATARYYTSHTKTMLPMRKSMPRSSRQCWATWRPPDDRKETQTAVVWSCLPLTPGRPKPSCKAQWKGEEDKADRRRGGRQHQGMDRPGVLQVPEGSGEQENNLRLCFARARLESSSVKWTIQAIES